MCLWPSAIVLTAVNILYKKKTVVGNVKWYSTLKNNLAVSLKTKHTLILQPSNHSAGHLSQRNENSVPTKTCMWLFIAALFVIAPNWKQPEPCSRWMMKQTAGHAYHGTLSKDEKEQTIGTGNNLDGPQGHYAKWKKTNLMLCDSTYIIFSK